MAKTSKVRKRLPAPFWTRHAGTILQASLIVAAGLWVFQPALDGGWIGDDIWYVTGNPLMQDPGAGVESLV